MEIKERVMLNLNEGSHVMEEQETEKKYQIPVKKMSAISMGLLNRIDQFGDEDDEEAREKLHILIEDLQQQGKASGNADDFHNYSTNLARRDEYDLACTVLEAGLKAFPTNVDLLADYLQYGVRSGHEEETRKIQKILLKIPKKRWTWRGFSFYVDHLQYLLERPCTEKAMEKLEKEIQEVTADFKKYFPYSEEPYITEAEMCKKNGEPDREEAVLKEALSKIKVAPKCSLRYADLLFDRGRFVEARSMIDRAKKDSNRTQVSVSDGYISYLSALCTISLVDEEERTYTEEEVFEIYSDFNLALNEFNRGQSFIRMIKSRTKMLVSKTTISVDEEKYENLARLLEQDNW